MDNNLLFEDWLFLAIDPCEIPFEIGYKINQTMQDFAEGEVRGRETMDKLEALGVAEPHLVIANQFEIMEVELSRRM